MRKLLDIITGFARTRRRAIARELATANNFDARAAMAEATGADALAATLRQWAGEHRANAAWWGAQ